MRRSSLAAVLVVGVIALAVIVWQHSMTVSVAELTRRGRSDLALASDRLASNLLRFRLLASWVAKDPRLAPGAATSEELSGVLLRANDLSGALDLVLLDRMLRPVASASGQAPGDLAEQDFTRRALDGALGRGVGVNAVFNRRAYYFAAPVLDAAGQVARVLVVVADISAIEAEFRGSRPVVFMSDPEGLIYFSNLTELALLQRNGVAGPRPFFEHSVTDTYGAEIWSMSAGRYLPARAVHVEQDLPVIGLHAEALVDLEPALSEAWLQAAVAGLTCSLLLGAIYVVSNQRRILADANAALEGRVADRTRDLTRANASLRAEVVERQEAERALKKAQDDLVQAGKLSALGKMSAGISHELNQPLMALQSFTENAAIFLDRGNTQAAAANLDRIADLARRMGRIIRNFRAFARQEKETVRRVDLVQVVEAAIELSASRIAKQGVELVLDLPHGPIWVQGGEVRLQQVVLNLVSNAIDAMSASHRRMLEVSVEPLVPVILTVRDTGPGISEPEKVFEPFYTTKEIGETDGVGLGLSISYGLVQSFGGSIRGANDPRGGAVFTVELQNWTDEMAA